MADKSIHPTSGMRPIEEVTNSLTHGIGIPVAIAGLVLSVVFASLRGSPWLIVACSLYGATLVLLYLASTLYHSARNLKWKRRFLILDHACIYLLIAGTYTPFALGPLRGPLGWTLIGIVWGGALIGLIREVFFPGRGGLLGSLVYLSMGWVCLIAIVPLYRNLSTMGFSFLLAGGLCYSAGVVFYLSRRMRFHHAVWHLFVLAGSTCHFLSILTLVV